MLGRLRPLVAVGVSALVLGAASTPVPAEAGATRARLPAARALCGPTRTETTGKMGDPALRELSGLTASQSQPRTLWAHNDSGDSARLFALTDDGTPEGTVSVDNASAVDWEDIAGGRGLDGSPALFVGDIGNNTGSRTTVTVYRLPEPVAPGRDRTASTSADRIALRYTDGAHDAEALLVDDRTGDLVIVTKADGVAGVYRAPGAAGAPDGTTVELVRVGDLGRSSRSGIGQRLAEATGFGSLVTAGDANAAARVAVARTYAGVDVYRWKRGTSLADALLLVPCEGASPLDPGFFQGEAIALARNGRSYFLASEGVGAPITRVRAAR